MGTSARESEATSAAGAARIEAWRDVHPAVASYISTLPAAWMSYPSCEASGELITSLRGYGAFDGLCPLPTPLDTLVTRGVKPDEWFPEVHYVALLLAIYDCTFHGNKDEFVAWATSIAGRRLEETIETPEEAESPAMFLLRASRLWHRFHRGTDLVVVLPSAEAAVTRIEYPLRLFPPLLIEYFARTHALSLTRVDAALPEVSVATTTDGEMAETTFTARWHVSQPRRL